MTQLRRRGLLASAIAAGVFAGSGVPLRAMPKKGGLLRAVFSNNSTAAAPSLFVCNITQGAVYDNLTEIAADGMLKGELAESWEASPDARTWVFNLRRDVLFHNGKPFTAADVVHSLQPRLAGMIETIESLNARQVRITLVTGSPDFPYRLADPRFPVFPEGQQRAFDPDSAGTGMYRVENYIPGKEFLGKRVAHHFKDGSAGWFDEVEIRALSSGEARITALLERRVDVIDLDRNQETARLSDHRGMKTIPDGNQPAIAMNLRLANTGNHRQADNGRIAERWWMA
jgi:peptide/nickel transport system substrate-binding protein